MRNNWKDEVENISKMIDKNMTMAQIGREYGVTRARMYQVFEKFGLACPIKQSKAFLRDKPPKYYWLSRILNNKGVKGKDKMYILENLEIPDVCPILGLELNYDGTGGQGWTREENSPSLDQVIPGKGYKFDNIAIISWRANRIKNNGTAQEHFKIAQFMDSFLNKKYNNIN